MAEQALLDRLKRYSKKCLTERTDGDFADAVWEAVEVIDGLLNDLQEALDTIEELTDTNVGKWIPVTERLPKESRWCLVICNEWGGRITRISAFVTDSFGNRFLEDSREISGFVTHWMPLPEPPKEE